MIEFRVKLSDKLVKLRILKRVQVEQPDAVLDQRHLAAKICHQMAEHAVMQSNYKAAINHYKVQNLELDGSRL